MELSEFLLGAVAGAVPTAITSGVFLWRGRRTDRTDQFKSVTEALSNLADGRLDEINNLRDEVRSFRSELERCEERNRTLGVEVQRQNVELLDLKRQVAEMGRGLARAQEDAAYFKRRWDERGENGTDSRH